MEPIRVCGSLWSHRVRRVRASNGDSTRAAVAGPCFDAARENSLAHRSHHCSGVKLDVSVAALAQLLKQRMLVACTRKCRKPEACTNYFLRALRVLRGSTSWLMRILVTGGAGFIGSHLVEKLLAANHDVVILDDFNDFYDPQIKQTNIAGFAKDVTVCHVDLRKNDSVQTVFGREKLDAIVHLAARAGVRPSIQSPRLYYDTNVLGTLHLLEAARVTGIQRFVFASSSSVYGASRSVPFSEAEHLTQTLSPYGATKIGGEFLCSTYSHLYQMRVVALRYFTVYGPRQRPDLAIHQFTRRIYAGQPIDQFGDGSTRRDYTYIDDIIQGTMAALDYDGPMYDVFNIGESQTIQLKDLILAIENALGKKAKINELPEQPGDMPRTYADISKARKLLGYNPTTKFSEGLPKFVEWFLRTQKTARTE
jgi:UDP-glucuronate 4-epimerase